MNIIPLVEGHFSVNKTKDFTLLNENILIDAGLGWKENNQPKIIQNLKENNLVPDDISKILISHLHKDHINGLVYKAEDGLKLTFPYAVLYIQKREYDFTITQTENLSFNLEILDFIVKNSKIVWLDDDQGNILTKIKYEVTGGHTPFLQVFWIEDQNEIAFFGADNLPLRAYLDYNIAYKSDYDGKKAMQDRQKWEELAKENHWKILFYHDLKMPIVQF